MCCNKYTHFQPPTGRNGGWACLLKAPATASLSAVDNARLLQLLGGFMLQFLVAQLPLVQQSVVRPWLERPAWQTCALQRMCGLWLCSMHPSSIRSPHILHPFSAVHDVAVLLLILELSYQFSLGISEQTRWTSLQFPSLLHMVCSVGPKTYSSHGRVMKPGTYS